MDIMLGVKAYIMVDSPHKTKDIISSFFLLNLSPSSPVNGRPTKAIKENNPVTSPAAPSPAPGLTAKPGKMGMVIPNAPKLIQLITNRNVNSKLHNLVGSFVFKLWAPLFYEYSYFPP